MENLTWRMMYVSQKAKPSNTDFHDYLSTPLLSHLGVEKKVDPSSPPQVTEDFDYVAHIRKLGSEGLSRERMPPTAFSPSNSSSPASSSSKNPTSVSSQSRKRPAPFLPMIAAEPISTLPLRSAAAFTLSSARPPPSAPHSNLSAGLKNHNQQQKPYVNNLESDHGFLFSLDPLAFEGPNESFANPTGLSSSISSSLTETPAARYPPLQSSITSLASTLMGTLQNNSRRPDHTFSSSAPKPIITPASQAPYSQLRRNNSLFLYNPSNIDYPVGPSSILSASNMRPDNSYTSHDYFDNLRSHTPQNIETMSALSSVIEPGALSANDSYPASLMGGGRNSVAESISSSVPGSVHGMQFRDPYGALSYPASWNESFFDDTPMAMPSSASSVHTNTGPPRANSVKRNTKKPRQNSKQEPPLSSGSTKSGGLNKQSGGGGGGGGNSSSTSQGSNIECANCHTKNTPLWRRNPQGEPLCNACGLFLKLHGTVRPLSLKTDVVKKRQRGQGLQLSTKKNSNNQQQASKASSTTSSSNGGDKPELGDRTRDGDDFFPTPVSKDNRKPRVDNRGAQETIAEPWSGLAAGSVQNGLTFPQGQIQTGPKLPADGLHPINEHMEKNFDWEHPTELPDTENGEPGHGKWDWLSMML